MTSIHKEQELTGGKEGLLDGFGKFFILIGSVCLVSALVYSLTVSDNIYGENNAVMWAIVGVGVFIHSLVLFALCSAGAEIIRIMKKSVGLQYSGKIKNPTIWQWRCSGCSGSISEKDKTCHRCEKDFEN